MADPGGDACADSATSAPRASNTLGEATSLNDGSHTRHSSAAQSSHATSHHRRGCGFSTTFVTHTDATQSARPFVTAIKDICPDSLVLLMLHRLPVAALAALPPERCAGGSLRQASAAPASAASAMQRCRAAQRVAAAESGLPELLQQPRGAAQPIDGVVLSSDLSPAQLSREHAGFAHIERRYVIPSLGRRVGTEDSDLERLRREVQTR